MTLLKTGFALLAVLLFAGCSSFMTYRTFDPPQPPDQVAALWIPINLEPMEVDGHNAGPHYIPVSDRFKIELLPGAHTFMVRYSGIAGGPSCEQEEMINSPAVKVALDAVKGHTYRLSYSRSEIDLLYAKQLTNITIRVDDITTNTSLVKHLNRGWQTRNVLIREPTGKVDSVTAPKPVTVPAPPAQAASPAASPSPAHTNPPPAAANPVTLEQLKESWRKADETERGEFMKWTVQPK